VNVRGANDSPEIHIRLHLSAAGTFLAPPARPSQGHVLRGALIIYRFDLMERDVLTARRRAASTSAASAHAPITARRFAARTTGSLLYALD